MVPNAKVALVIVEPLVRIEPAPMVSFAAAVMAPEVWTVVPKLRVVEEPIIEPLVMVELAPMMSPPVVFEVLMLPDISTAAPKLRVVPVAMVLPLAIMELAPWCHW